MKKLLDSRHVVGSNHDLCHWAICGQASGHGKQEAEEQIQWLRAPRREKVDDLVVGITFVLYI
jgi:hypothetical protein